MKYVLNILLALIPIALSAQQDVQLPGVVVEQNSKLKTGKVVYVQGASIKAARATPQLSDANGKFKLIFGDLPLGNVARIEVSRNGYEVVNTKVLQAAAITGRQEPLEIVMCKSGLLYENQVAYYRIATDASREQYEKKVRILEQGGKNKDELIARLQKEMNTQISSKEEAIKALKEQYQHIYSESQALANKLVTVNLDDESGTYQRAFKAFQSRDIETAILLLDSVDLEKRLATNSTELRKEESSGLNFQQNAERRKKQIRQDISQCMFKSRLHILKYEYKTARQTYLLALQYDSSNIENLWEVASFLLNQKEDSLAKKYFDQILSYSHTDYNKAVALADIGTAYKNAGAYEEAEKYFPLSVKILNELYVKDANAHRLVLTNTLTNFGLLYYEWEYYSLAENYFDKADNIYTEAYDSLDNALIPDAENLSWFHILNYQCLIYFKNKSYYGAMRHSYFQSIPVLKRSMRKNPQPYTALLARAIYNEGLSFFYLRNYDEAADDLNEGMDLIRELAEKEPEKYTSDLADMLNGLGRLCYELMFYSAADQYYLEALKIIRQASEKQPSDLNLSYLANILNNLGQLYGELKKYTKAEEFYVEALKINRQLVEKKQAYFKDLANVQAGLGLLYYHQNNNNQATGYYKEALENYKKLTEKNEDIYSPYVGNTLYSLGRIYMDLNKPDIAEQQFTEALTIQNRIVQKEKKMVNMDKSATLFSYLTTMSKTLNALDLLYSKGRSNPKSGLYAEAKKEFIGLSEANKLKPYDSVVILSEQGKFCYKLQLYAMAEQSYEKALNKYAALSEHDRSSGEQFDAVTASVDLIKVYKKALETTKDFSYRAKAIKLLDKVKQMNESDPDSYSYSENQKLIQDFEGVFENATAKSLKVTSGFLESIEKRMSSIVGEGKDTTGVIVSLEKVIRELEIGHKEGPQNQKLNYLLSVAYGTVSWYYALQKDYPKTLKAAQKGLALDSTQTWIYGNLALGYLLQGKWPEAREIYAKYKDTYSAEFLDDLRALKEAGIIVPKMREAEEFILR